MKQRVEEMEREAQKLRELQAAAAAESASGDGDHVGADGSAPMDAEDDKALADGRSVFVGNVRFSIKERRSSIPHCANQLRWTTVLRQKRSRVTSRRVGLLTESLFYVTSSPGIQKG